MLLGAALCHGAENIFSLQMADADSAAVNPPWIYRTQWNRLQARINALRHKATELDLQNRRLTAELARVLEEKRKLWQTVELLEAQAAKQSNL
jgi:hypothetical protein